MDPLGEIARRFPLIARPRPACQALGMRVEEVTRLAHAAEAARDAPLSLAAEAHNKAALPASDCEAWWRARRLGSERAFHVCLRR